MSLRLGVLVFAIGCSSSGGAPRPAEPAPAPIASEPAPAAQNREEAPAKPAADTAAPAPSDPQRPAGVTDAYIATADKLVAVMQKLGSELSAAGSDCAKAAAALTASSKQLAPLKGDIQKLEQAGKADPEVKAWFEANYMSKMMTAIGPIMGIAQTCGKDPAFTKAMDSLDMGG